MSCHITYQPCAVVRHYDREMCIRDRSGRAIFEYLSKKSYFTALADEEFVKEFTELY